MQSENALFLWSLLKSLLALTLSAAILIPAYLALQPDFRPADKPPTPSKTYYGNDFSVILGTAKERGKILDLQQLSDGGRALLMRRTHLKAAEYPFVQFRIANRHPGEIVYLLWRTAEKPQNIHNTPLYWSGDGLTSLNLAKIADWQGSISEVGFDIYGDLRKQPLEIHNLTISPYSSKTLISTIWSEWGAFEGWTQKSINYLNGTPKNPVLSPTIALAAWSGLAMVLLALAQFIQKGRDIVSFGAAALLPWIILDLLWQTNLTTQLSETRISFQDKSLHEKKLADHDGDLYRYAHYLKNNVLPEPGPRIFLLHDSDIYDGHIFHRLRTQFHLLPHNTYNFDRYPQPAYLKSGDYIITLGAIGGLSFNRADNTLHWGNDSSLVVTLIDSHPSGNVYKVGAAEL
jgi:hypothetical protein